jgi:hypothetical protein
MHLWSDGLEPESDFLAAVELEDRRREAGWAPFWRYRGLGRYGEQLENLYRHVPRSQVLTLRYRTLVEEPHRSVQRVLEFLGAPAAEPRPVPHDNSRPFRPELTPDQRRHVLEPLLDDLTLLEQLTGESFDDWRSDVGGGSFATRAVLDQTSSSVTRSWAPSGRASS